MSLAQTNLFHFCSVIFGFGKALTRRSLRTLYTRRVTTADCVLCFSVWRNLKIDSPAVFGYRRLGTGQLASSQKCPYGLRSLFLARQKIRHPNKSPEVMCFFSGFFYLFIYFFFLEEQFLSLMLMSAGSQHSLINH